MQHGPAARERLLVIDLDDRGLALETHRVVIDKARGEEGVGAQPALELRIARLERLLVFEVGAEEIAALLDVADPRLPEEVEQVDPLDGDVAEAAALLPVPDDAVAGRAGLELLPHGVVIDPLEAVLLEDAGQDRAQKPRLLAVARLAREDDRLGEGIHRVGVLGDDHVMQPPARALVALLGAQAAAALLELVAQLPPVLRGDDAPLETGLAALVLLQHGCEVPQPRCVNRWHGFLSPLYVRRNSLPSVSVIARQCAHCRGDGALPRAHARVLFAPSPFRGNPFLSVRVTRLAAGSTDSHTSDTVTGSE